MDWMNRIESLGLGNLTAKTRRAPRGFGGLMLRWAGWIFHAEVRVCGRYGPDGPWSMVNRSAWLGAAYAGNLDLSDHVRSVGFGEW